jgi:Fe-S-cluster-containing dehydrogenase component
MEEEKNNVNNNDNLSEDKKEAKRRNFIKSALLVSGGLLASVGIVKTPSLFRKKNKPQVAKVFPDYDKVKIDKTSHLLVRMQDELKKAMLKPIEERNWIMVIDLRKCTGCGACTVSCIAENHLPAGVVYRPVMEEELGHYPHVSNRSTPRPCFQCKNAPCTPVCPVRATWKGEDGIVQMDYNQCIGCRYCMTACPYHARTFDFGYNYTDGTPSRQPYENIANFEYNKRWDQKKGKSPIGNVRKCHFCTHKLNAGMLPSCVTTCIGYATYFGDSNNRDSVVSELISLPNVVRLKEEMGTEPRVYYLV